MAKIRSTTELIYDSRNGNQGIIQLEIDGWEFKPTTNTYLAKVNDYVIEEIEIIDEEINNFEVVCQFCFHNIDIGEGNNFKELFLEAMKLFLRNEVNFIADEQFIGFIVGDVENYNIITYTNYDQIIEVIKQQNCLVKNEEDDCNPADEKARELLEKRKKARQLLARAKNNDDDTPLTLADLVSILIANGNGVTPFNVWDMNFYLFNNQFSRMKMLEEFNINIRSLLAGADPKNIDMQHWMSKIR